MAFSAAHLTIGSSPSRASGFCLMFAARCSTASPTAFQCLYDADDGSGGSGSSNLAQLMTDTGTTGVLGTWTSTSGWDTMSLDTDTGWYVFALVFSGTSLKVLYRADAATSWTTFNAPGSTAGTYNTQYLLSDLVSENATQWEMCAFKQWSAVLTDPQLLSESFQADPIITANLWSVLKLNTNSGTDTSGQGHSWTIVGTPTQTTSFPTSVSFAAASGSVRRPAPGALNRRLPPFWPPSQVPRSVQVIQTAPASLPLAGVNATALAPTTTASQPASLPLDGVDATALPPTASSGSPASLPLNSATATALTPTATPASQPASLPLGSAIATALSMTGAPSQPASLPLASATATGLTPAASKPVKLVVVGNSFPNGLYGGGHSSYALARSLGLLAHLPSGTVVSNQCTDGIDIDTLQSQYASQVRPLFDSTYRCVVIAFECDDQVAGGSTAAQCISKWQTYQSGAHADGFEFVYCTNWPINDAAVATTVDAADVLARTAGFDFVIDFDLATRGGGALYSTALGTWQPSNSNVYDDGIEHLTDGSGAGYDLASIWAAGQLSTYLSYVSVSAGGARPPTTTPKKLNLRTPPFWPPSQVPRSTQNAPTAAAASLPLVGADATALTPSAGASQPASLPLATSDATALPPTASAASQPASLPLATSDATSLTPSAGAGNPAILQLATANATALSIAASQVQPATMPVSSAVATALQPGANFVYLLPIAFVDAVALSPGASSTQPAVLPIADAHAFALNPGQQARTGRMRGRSARRAAA